MQIIKCVSANNDVIRERCEMPTRCLPAASLRTAYRLPAARVLMWVASYLIYKALWPIWRAISAVGSIFLPALREMPGGGSRSAGQALGAGGDVVEGECRRHAGVKAHHADHVGDALMAETSTALRSTNPISSVLFPFKMMTLEGSFVGTLDDLRERLALVQASNISSRRYRSRRGPPTRRTRHRAT